MVKKGKKKAEKLSPLPPPPVSEWRKRLRNDEVDEGIEEQREEVRSGRSNPTKPVFRERSNLTRKRMTMFAGALIPPERLWMRRNWEVS